MGREQTQKFGGKNGSELLHDFRPLTTPTPITTERTKPPRDNIFGIGGTKEDPNPYKTPPQIDFQTFTQGLFYDLTGGISPFSGEPLPVPPTASPTGNGNGNGNGNGRCTLDDIEKGGDPTCGVKEFFMGVPAGTYCKCTSWWGNGTTTETKCECEACKNGTGDCSNKKPCCNAWDVLCEVGGECSKPKPPDEECDLGCLVTGRGCDCGCKDMKPCTTCDSDICKECDAWDIQCEDCRKKDGTCTPPPETKTMLFWAKIIAVVIGIGVFLWLLRPLFSRGSKPTGGFTIIPT